LFGITAKVHIANAIQDDEALMAAPLLEVGKMAAAFVLARAPEGKAARGSFGKYNVSKVEGRNYLVKPGRPQPEENRLARWPNGVSIYPSHGSWKEAQGQTERTFKESLKLWRSLQVKMLSPRKVRVLFTKGRGTGITNARLAAKLNRDIGVSMLDLTRGEMVDIERFVAKAMPARLLDALKYVDMSVKARKKLRSAQNALRKAKLAHGKAKRSLKP